MKDLKKTAQHTESNFLQWWSYFST